MDSDTPRLSDLSLSLSLPPAGIMASGNFPRLQQQRLLGAPEVRGGQLQRPHRPGSNPPLFGPYLNAHHLALSVQQTD